MSDNNELKDFPLDKQNFIFIGLGLAIVIIGFFLMSGGGGEEPSSFSEGAFSARRMYAAPLTILAGYGLVMWGIIKK